jgi:hypothetical protein
MNDFLCQEKQNKVIKNTNLVKTRFSKHYNVLINDKIKNCKLHLIVFIIFIICSDLIFQAFVK